MKIPFVDLKAQYKELKPEIQNKINTVLEHGQYIMGPEVNELERKLASYAGATNCIAVASGTDALLISLMALGVGPGDEVITTPFTFIATAEVIVLLGAKPIFVDIEIDTCNIDANLIEAVITPRTKAIMPVSLYGQPADMDTVNAIAAKHKIPVIEDAAQSFGAEYRGKKSCNLSTIGCTSFFPSKPLGCYGDGGAIFTSNSDIADVCREIRFHGQSDHYAHNRVGVGGRMDTLQAAILLAKLETFAAETRKRIAIGKKYDQLIGDMGIEKIRQRKNRQSVYAQYTVFLKDREAVQTSLIGKKIPTAIHYPVPVNKQPGYNKSCSSKVYLNAISASKTVLSLPMSAYLKNSQQEFICASLKEAYIKTE